MGSEPPAASGDDASARSKRKFGNYEILSLLGKGGMASVYRAKVLSGPRLGWEVAIKRLLPDLTRDPEYVELFLREAQLTKSLTHPNIVNVYEVGALEHIYFMEMDLIDGRDLGQILQKCRQRKIPLPIDFGVYLTKVLLEALSFAHQAVAPDGAPLHIVHCDISPSNLFISRTGEIKLGDFGVACVRASSQEAAAVVAGKPYYLSPEVIGGTISQEGDLWAVAVSLYELLTLERPFTGTTPKEVFRNIRARTYQPVSFARPDVSAELAAIFDRAFHKDRAKRFQSAAEFAQALEHLYDERVGNALGIAAVVRGLFGASDRPGTQKP
jgi:eukaryotic-like serine/threonine-protein kinase